MQLNPTILTDDKQSYIEQVTRDAKFAMELDIDVIDWEYSPGKTLTALESLAVEVQIPLNFDLMLDYPAGSVEVLLQDRRVTKVIVNIRSKEDLVPLFTTIKATGRQAAVSFSMDEEYEKVREMFEMVDAIHVFAIEPGAQGNEFRPEMLEYADRLKADGFKGIIGLDGGVNSKTIPLILQHSFDVAVVGSAIAKSTDPEKTYKELAKMISRMSEND